MPYQPIENYGVIGDLRTAALIGKNGSLDWLCLPHFDSPSVFAALLDDTKGGRFEIAPTCDDVTFKQLYWPETNILVTRFLSPTGVAEVVDFMPVSETQRLVRRVRCVRGGVSFRAFCQPAFNYARDPHGIELTAEGAAFHTTNFSLALATLLPLQQDEMSVTTDFSLREGETASFVLASLGPKDAMLPCPSEGAMEELFQDTVSYWRRWLSKCTYQGRWREMVQRSALTLKLLTFAPTGALVAAPTCGLPEEVGGERNWDYRYTWIRDAAFSLYGLLRIGFTEEAAAFMAWLAEHCLADSPDGSLEPDVPYWRADAPTRGAFRTPRRLPGSARCASVTTPPANSSSTSTASSGRRIPLQQVWCAHLLRLWQKVRRLLNWLCDNWRRPDEGIWEAPGRPSAERLLQSHVLGRPRPWGAAGREAFVSFGA